MHSTMGASPSARTTHRRARVATPRTHAGSIHSMLPCSGRMRSCPEVRWLACRPRFSTKLLIAPLPTRRMAAARPSRRRKRPRRASAPSAATATARLACCPDRSCRRRSGRQRSWLRRRWRSADGGLERQAQSVGRQTRRRLTSSVGSCVTVRRTVVSKRRLKAYALVARLSSVPVRGGVF